MSDDNNIDMPSAPAETTVSEPPRASSDASFSRRRSTRSLGMPAANQTGTMVVSSESLAAPSKKRFDRERHFALALENETSLEMSGSRFVQQIMGEIQHVFDKISAPSDNIMQTDAELANRRVSCQRDGLYALRRICTVWTELPSIGSVVDDAVITFTAYSFAAHGAMKNKNSKAMQWQIAKLLSALSSPPDDDVEAYPRSQQRIDDCVTAMKMQYQIWQNEMLQEGNFTTAILGEVEPDIKLNNIELTYTPLSEPSTAAQMMSSVGLAEAAKDEQYESLEIYVSGKVLKNKTQKGADTQDQVLIARAAEAAEAARAKEEAATNESPVVGSSRRKRTGNDKDEDASKQTPKRTKAQPRKRKTATPSNNEDTMMADADGSPVAQPPKKRGRKPQVKDASAPDDSKQSTGFPIENGYNGGPSGNDTIAKSIKKPGGAASKWLADEDDLLHQIVDDDPDMQLQDVYRKWAEEIANTPYQSGKMATHGYRTDYIPFDRDAKPMNDKPSREFDISWRTFQSVRQHIEAFKSWRSEEDPVEKARKYRERRVFPANPVAHLPKRAPPPRPTFFSDGTTRVPPAPGSTISTSTASRYAVRVPNTGKIIFYGCNPVIKSSNPSNHGWTPINNPSSGIYTPYQAPAPTKRRAKAKPKKPSMFSNVLQGLGIPSSETHSAREITWLEPETPTNYRYLGRQADLSPEQAQGNEQEGEQNAAEGDMAWVKDLPAGGEYAPGDALVDTIEDFVAQQSMGEDEDADPEVGPDTAQNFPAQRSLRQIIEANEKMGEHMETGEEHALDESGFETMEHTLQRIHDMENTPTTSRPARKRRPFKPRRRGVIRPGDYDDSDEGESSMRQPSEQGPHNPFEEIARQGRELAQLQDQIGRSSRLQNKELTAGRQIDFTRTKAAMIEAGFWGGPRNDAPYVASPAAPTADPVGTVEDEASGDEVEAAVDVAGEEDGAE